MLGKLRNKLLLIALLSCFHTAALAAPVIPIIAILATAAGYTYLAVALVVAYTVYGTASQRKAAKQAAARQRAEYNAGLQDRTITNVATDSPHRVIYGQARVGSSIVAMFTGGSKDQYKYLVCIHAAHECEEIGDIYIAGKKLGELDENGDVIAGDFTSATNYNVAGSERAQEYFTGTTHTMTYSLDPFADMAYDGRGISVFGRDTAEASWEVVPYTRPKSSKDITVSGEKAYYLVSYTHQTQNPRVRVVKHLGTPTDPADASLIAAFPDKWTTDSTLRGFCYTVVRLDLRQPEFQSGIPTIEVVIKGKKLYDPRTELTVWSDNPAVAVYDYLTSDLCGVPASDLPIAQYIAAANACDEEVGVGKRYTINGTVSSDQSQSQVLEAMAQCMAGSIVSTTWDIYAGKYVAPVMALNQTDIVGSVAITPGISDADLYNGVKGQYVGEENLWVATDYKPFQNATYLAVDGRDLFNSIDMQFTNTVQRVHNLCRIFVEDQRNGFTIKAEFSLKAWGLKVGQRVTFTSPFFGQTAKVYRITDKKFSPTSAIELTLKEDAASIWDEADTVVIDDTPNTNLADPFSLDALISLSCASGTEALFVQSDGTVGSRILATWPTATTQSVVDAGFVELQWQEIGSDVWSTQQVAGANTQSYINGVTDGTFYVVRIRAVNPTLNVKSDWTYAETHQVVGKTEPPGNVLWFSIDGNILTWGTVSDLDLAGYEIRYHYGSNASWGDAAPLHTGFLTQSPYTPDNLPQGQITLMLRAVDTSGNLSDVAAVIETQLGDVLVANVVETFDFKAGGYVGTLTGCSIVGGSLLADGTLNFYGSDGATFYSVINESSFFNDYYSAMSYETLEVTPSLAATGSKLTLNAPLVGDSVFIEYRISGLTPLYSVNDGDEFFALDTDNFYAPPPDAYQSWPGQVVAKPLQYQFRFSIGQGITQGVIDVCNAVVDVPDRTETVNSFVISDIGSRLPLSSAFNVIQNVQLTLEADGNGATTVEIIDKSETIGPLVYCRNAAGVQVAGLVDAIIQGY